MDDRIQGDAEGRYQSLIAALGTVPRDAYARHVLMRLAMAYDQATIGALADSIRYATGRALQPYLSILGEISPLVRASKEITPQAEIVIALPQALAREIIGAANGISS